MYNTYSTETFEKQVNKKFEIYNSLFLNLPYNKERNVGSLIPILYQFCKKGLKSGHHPQKILDSFLKKYTNIEHEEDKIDFMFRVVQYVERQIVLFDSVEDAAFKNTVDKDEDLSIKDLFQYLESGEIENNLSEQLASFSARIVFTAHPTQFYPPAVLDIINRLRSLIAKNQINQIDQTLQQLGLTSLINIQKPTPLDEAKNIIYFLRSIYYDAVGEMYGHIKNGLRDKKFDNPNIIKLGFWPGGDRDGNPFVTAKITMQVADELRTTLMKCYYADIVKLQKKLSFRGIDELLEKLRKSLYDLMFNPNKSITYDEILNPLYEVKKLLKTDYHNLYKNELEQVVDKVRIFKTHFASLDIRQDHRMHKKVVEAILIKEKLIEEKIEELNKSELIDILLNKKLLADSQRFDEEIVKETINNIYQLKTIQQKNGEEGCNRYIISNSEDIYSVLFVYALFRWCGWENKTISFDIIPLFETMSGMKASEAVMKELFEIEEYRQHVKQRGDNQTIMVGFSDGTKDGGYLKANWAIFETKETLSAVCKQYDIKAIFFDGRGGPPSRGGGKTHRFYAAQSDKISNHEIQLTIQGQTITSKYGSKEQFTHHCEQLLTAGLSRNIFQKGNDISTDGRKIIEELAELSYKSYSQLKAHEKFLPYLEKKSPLKYYAHAKVASRPGKRGGKKKLEFSDLRAISFVGAWSQLKQNVPGYFGMGTAVKTLVDKGRLEELKKVYDETPIFRALILNSMMSLYKSKFKLTNYMGDDEEFGAFWKILYDEYKLSKEMMLLISGHDVLMEEEPNSRESIKIREKIVLPLVVVQQYAQQKVAQEVGNKDVYEKIITRSLYGNINASRNSV